jgi:hypothetical protein
MGVVVALAACVLRGVLLRLAGVEGPGPRSSSGGLALGEDAIV